MTLPSPACGGRCPEGGWGSFGLWPLAFGLWPLGFGLWALGFGLWNSGSRCLGSPSRLRPTLTPAPAPRPGPCAGARSFKEQRTSGSQAAPLTPQAGEGLAVRALAVRPKKKRPRLQGRSTSLKQPQTQKLCV
ncbi:MAG: hypothetical protein DI584_12770 [Stenotrophomonas sp.]|nr:MAG: hypothetical protein DI584_12770 [Stenotrophomonas sp.]